MPNSKGLFCLPIRGFIILKIIFFVQENYFELEGKAFKYSGGPKFSYSKAKRKQKIDRIE